MKRVAVIGAGITGIQAALDLVDHGIEVVLIEKEPFIGGHVSRMDTVYPTGDSAMCILSAKMDTVFRHPQIHLHTLTEVTDLSGSVGSFILSLRRHPRYVVPDRCDGCGQCTALCPVEVYNRHDAGIGVRKAIYLSNPQAVPPVFVRDSEHCIECGLCYDVCSYDAILRTTEDSDEDFTICDITSVIVCTGYSMYDPSNEPRYRYLRLPDVITSLEFERMIDTGGPTGGEIKRISDGMTPKSIVFIQCVGSRNVAIRRNFCSSVCCMYTIKAANAVKEKYGDSIDVTILKTDTRAYGKGYQEYKKRIKHTHDIRSLRCMPGSIEHGDGGKMKIVVERIKKKEGPGTRIELLEPELVVLSAGLQPSAGTSRIADLLGISRSEESGFFNTVNYVTDPTGTVRPGVYIAGCAGAPKDINDSLQQGEAAAMKAFIDMSLHAEADSGSDL